MEEIKKTIKDFFYFIDEDIKVDFCLQEDASLCVDVKMKDPQILIGEKGQTLVETEKLLKTLARKKSEDPLFIYLDVNDYRRRKKEYLITIAKEAGEEVSLTGIEKKFPPMSPFERRIIHTALAEIKDLDTESTGEGRDRRLIIKKKREE